MEYFRYYVYRKKVNLLTDHQALQPLLKRNRAHKQYSARLTRWLDRLSHFDVNLQYTADKNIPLTDFLSRHPIIHNTETETQCEQDENNYELFFGFNQIYGLFEFNRTNGGITQYLERLRTTQDTDQSRNTLQKCKLARTEISIQTISPQSNIAIESAKGNSNISLLVPNMDRVNGIGMNFIFKKNGVTRPKQPDYKKNVIESYSQI